MEPIQPVVATASNPSQDGVVVALPGCSVTPVANQKRRGRLPKAVPSLSAARTAKQERQERIRAIEADLIQLDSFVDVVEISIDRARQLVADIRAKAH